MRNRILYCWITLLVLIGGSLSAVAASNESNINAESLLSQMQTAMQNSRYSIKFININKQNVESLQYQHDNQQGKITAKLQQLDGPERTIVQNGKHIHYFDSQGRDFSLNSEHIIDRLPPIIYANFSYLSHYYNFIFLGRDRIADRRCDMVRVVARDGSRYSYVVWIDSRNKLLLRADLLDSHAEILSQFRVLQISQDKIDSQIDTNNLATSKELQAPATHQLTSWHLTWLPEGMQQISYQPGLLLNEPKLQPAQLANQHSPVETAFYSDGLFTFVINILPATPDNVLQDNVIYAGHQLIYTERRQNNEIVVIGDLPLTTAKKIVQNLQFAKETP